MNTPSASQVNKPLDRRTFEELLRAHEKALRSYILAMVPRWFDAEDILQATLVQLWQEFEGLRDPAAFGAWSKKVAYFRVLTYRRRLGRERLTFTDEFVDMVGAERAAAAESWEAGQRALAGCVESLAPKQRELIELRYVQNRSIEQLGAAIGKSVQATYRSLSRIRRLLRECVERHQKEAMP